MATVPYFATSRRHQRSNSQLQQLIPLASQQQEMQQPNTSTWPPIQSRSNNVEKGVRLSILGSDSSSYYRLSGISNQNNSNDGIEESGARGRCMQMLEENLRLLIGSLALAILGTALIFFSVFVTFLPNDMDVHGWIFLVVGILFAIPGFYHLIYICCALSGRPGYSFEQLPTVAKNTKTSIIYYN